ncbi:MAG: hypothetical protein R3C43_09725 [Chloroflexota bacterium]
MKNLPLQSCVKESVAADATFIYELVLALIRAKDAENYIAGVMPFITLFIHESHKLLDPHFNLGGLLTVDQEDLVEVSRHRIKLLDNPKATIDDIAEKFRVIRASQHAYFSCAFQRNDMAWFCYDGHLICSTHLWLYNFDLSDVQALKQIPQTTWESLSRYTKTLAGPSVLSLSLPQLSSSFLDGNVTFDDVESDIFYDHGPLGDFQKHAPSLTAILCQVNCAQFLLRDLATRNPLTFFKIKFITAYHAFSSLKAINASLLAIRSTAVTQFFSRIDNIPNSSWVLGQSHLRNYLVHYDPHPKTNISSTATHYDVIEQLACRKFNSIDLLLDQQLEQLSQILEADLSLTHESLRAGK